MATQIRVETQDDSRVVYLDLSGDQPMTANYQFKDIQDFKSNKGNHTFNFRIPSTPNNDVFFGDYFEVTQFGNYNTKIKVQATITKDSLEVFEGYLQLTNVFVSNDVTHHYECVVFSSVSSLGQVLTGKYLSEFDFSEYDHQMNLNVVSTSMNRDVTPLLNGDIVYSMYDYSGAMFGGNVSGSISNSNNPLSVFNLKPQIRANKVFNKILLESGFTYESSFIDTELNDLYLDLNSGSNDSLTEMNESFYEVNLTASGSQTFIATNGYHTIIHNNTSGNNYTNNSGDYNETTGIYSPSNFWSATAINISINLSQPASLDGTLVSIVLYDITNNEAVIQGFPLDIVQVTDFALAISFEAYFLNVNNEYEIRCLVTNSQNESASITVESGIVQFSPLPQTYSIDVDGTPTPITGILGFDVARNFPKVKAIDFITSFAKKFNLVIIPDDQQPTHLYIQPYSDWIDQGSDLDWTEKLDVSKDVQLKPTADLQAKSLIFTDQKSDDFMNSLFEQQTSKIYGSQYVDNTSNDFGKDKEEIKTIFNPTITSYIPNTGIRSSICHNGNGQSVSGFKLSYYSGYGGSDVNGESVWLTDTVATQQFSSFSIFQNYEDIVVTPQTKCLSFMGESTGALGYPVPLNGAYSVYWKRYIEETYSREARLLIATFKLSALDINNLSFNDIIFVKNEYFRINKINNYPLIGQGNCNVELVKVQRTNLIATSGIECTSSPSYLTAGGIVIFTNNSSGVVETPTQECCQANGYLYEFSQCWNQTNDFNDPKQKVPNPNRSTEIVLGGNNSASGVFNQVLGNNNLITDFNIIKGSRNLVEYSSDFTNINGNDNTIRANIKGFDIVGNNNLSDPLAQDFDGSEIKIFTRQSYFNTSIQGDYGQTIASGEFMLSGGTDPLYNKTGRSQSGHFIKHGFTDGKEEISIGQNGQYTIDTGSDSILSNGTNSFRLPFPSQMMFEMTISGSERGTTTDRSQKYMFRKYTGVIVNNNNSYRPTILQLSKDISKESTEFNIVDISLEFPMPYIEGAIGSKKVANEGLFYFKIDTDDRAYNLGDVDWSIDFKYTFQTLQNIDVSSNRLPFEPSEITGLKLWLDSADAITLTHSSGAVTQWDDKSGNGYDMIAPTSTARPTYNQDLSDPSITFDGINDVLINTDSSLHTITDIRSTTFVVFKSAITTSENYGQMIAGVCGGTRQKQGFAINVTQGQGSNSIAFLNNNSQNYNCSINNVSVLERQVITGRRAGTTQYILDQEQNTDTNSSATNTTSDIYSIGAVVSSSGTSDRNEFRGEIHEIIVYNVELTDSETQQVQNYLQSKWNT